MTGDLLTLSTREMDTLAILTRLAERRMTQAEAARCLGRSVRQVRRLLRAFEQDGPAGLRDKRRGRPAPNRIPKAYQQRALVLVRAHYADFGPTFAAEKLREYHDIRVATETLRRWMIDDGIWLTRRQRKKRVQQPRHRRDCYGELVQIDGCEHHWFEDRGRKCVLLVYVDDATGKLMALWMCESESSFSYFHATRAYLECHGKPVAFYSDKASVFRVNAKRPKAGDGFTQFGRAMSDLNIDVICANTPAAKGRVERAHQTLQDRLVKELRLRRISTMQEANRYLPDFMDDYNRRFARAARNDHDAHRPLTERDCLDDIFTWQEQRRVTEQLTVHHKRTMYLLEPTEEAKAAAKKRVTVVEYEDGAVSIRYRGVALAARPFHKDGCVTQASIVDNKLLSGALTEIRARQQQREQELVRSAKSKREKRIVRDRFAGRLPAPGT
jgi:transposase